MSFCSLATQQLSGACAVALTRKESTVRAGLSRGQDCPQISPRSEGEVHSGRASLACIRNEVQERGATCAAAEVVDRVMKFHWYVFFFFFGIRIIVALFVVVVVVIVVVVVVAAAAAAAAAAAVVVVVVDCCSDRFRGRNEIETRKFGKKKQIWKKNTIQ